MVENESGSLSKALLEHQRSSETVMARIEAGADLAAPRATPNVETEDPGYLTMIERAQVMKAMLNQEIDSQEEKSLKIDKIGLILNEILYLESSKPPEERLTSVEIIAMTAALLKKEYTEDRLKMILEETQRLAKSSSLKKLIQGDMKGTSTLSSTPKDHYEPEVSLVNYEDIMEEHSKRIIKPDTFLGHSNQVLSVALSADGRFIVSGSADKTLKLWNIHERREEYAFTGHTDFIWSVALSADCKLIASGSEDKTVKLWSIQERKEECTFSHTDVVNSVAMSADGRFVVSGSNDRTIKLWNILEKTNDYTFTGHTRAVVAVAVSPDCRYIVSGGGDRTIRLWSIQGRMEEFTFYGHSGEVSSVTVSADCRFIVSGSDDCTIKIWSILEKRNEFTLTGHTSLVKSVAMSADGRFIASGSSDNTVKLWNVKNQSEVRSFTGHTDRVSSVAVSADGSFVISASTDKTIKIWNFREEKKTERIVTGYYSSVRSVALSADRRFIVIGKDDTNLQLWNIEEWREECTLSGHTGFVWSVAVSPDGRFIASGSWDMTIKIWSMKERVEECTFTGHTAVIISVAVTADSRFIVSASEDKTIKMWSVLEKKHEHTFLGHTDVVFSVAASADGRYIVSGSGDKTIKLWNIEERKEESTLAGHTMGVFSVAVTTDSRFIVSGSIDRTVKLWNIKELREEWTFAGHTDIVYSVTVSADCRFIVSSSSDKTIKLWNIEERKEECTFAGHTQWIFSVAVIADSRFIVSGSVDTTIKLWNMQEWRKECMFTRDRDFDRPVAVSGDCRLIVSGSYTKSVQVWSIAERREECTFTGHTDNVISVAISADSRFIASGSIDNTIKVWNMHERVEECTFSGLKEIENVLISADGKFIISKESNCTVKIWNVVTKKKESFLLAQHSCLLKEILEINNLRNCKILATPEFLVLTFELEIFHVVRIHNGDLQFSFDLGVNSSKTSLFNENFLKYLNSPEALSISSEYANKYEGILRFSLAHYFCYSGSAEKLKLLVENPNFTIGADAFRRSPFYYAIKKKRQDCVDLLLEKIGEMRMKDLKNHDLSMLAIRNDFLLLIQNSSRQVHHLLLGLLSSSSLIYAKVPNNLPILQVSFIQNPRLDDFPQNGLEDIPIVLQHSIFPLIGESGCEYNIALLEGIIDCKSSQGIRSPIINHIVTIQFNAIWHWVIGYTVLLSMNMILLIFLIGLKSFDLYLVAPFLLVNTLLIIWEAIQISTDAKGYLEDNWNYLDIARVFATVGWVILGLFGVSSLYFTWLVALLNLLRGITVFRLFDGTRFYIDLIFRSLSDIKYFFLMFAYSTFTFGFLLMISRDQGLGFDSIWGESYDLNFGNYEDTNSGIYFLQYIAYFGATVINVVLMLNLLISILGDSYERFQLEQNIVDIKEKAKISMELQLMMFWSNKQSILKHLRLCNSAFQGEDDQEWEGRIRFMDKKLDKTLREIIDKIGEAQPTESSKSIETFINNSTTSMEGNISSLNSKISDIRTSLEGKINSMEGNITSVGSKINDINASLETKINERSTLLEAKISDITTFLETRITSVEGKINDISASLENKISDISESLEIKIEDRSTLLEGKINDLNQKLEIILSIISK